MRLSKKYKYLNTPHQSLESTIFRTNKPLTKVIQVKGLALIKGNPHIFKNNQLTTFNGRISMQRVYATINDTLISSTINVFSSTGKKINMTSLNNPHITRLPDTTEKTPRPNIEQVICLFSSSDTIRGKQCNTRTTKKTVNRLVQRIVTNTAEIKYNKITSLNKPLILNSNHMSLE